MLRGLLTVEGGESALPFVRQFYGSVSTYLWQDDEGIVHDVHQGEGGEQGDALMPALFALGQHQALVAVHDQLTPQERLFAFHDDIYAVCSPERVSDIHNMLQRELWIHSRIQVHQGKTQLWNRGGVEPRGWELLAANAVRSDPDALCGEVTRRCPPTSKASRSLELHWGAQNTCRPCWNVFPRLIRDWLIGSPTSRICSPLGHSCCSVLRLAQITSSGWCILKPLARSLPATTCPCGDVWRFFWT